MGTWSVHKSEIPSLFKELKKLRGVRCSVLEIHANESSEFFGCDLTNEEPATHEIYDESLGNMGDYPFRIFSTVGIHWLEKNLSPRTYAKFIILRLRGLERE
jgi:hypothetical protein